VAEARLTLPEELRSAFKEPFGPVETDPEALLATVEGPLIAVGDIVTYHFRRVGHAPAVAVVDERTKREAVDEEVWDVVEPDDEVVVENPAGTVTESLCRELAAAIAAADGRTIRVEGEEDLATLPAVVAAPDGASVVYGQPDEGMVHVRVDAAARAEMRELLSRMEGDLAAVLTALGAE